jgi:hypothetical protein
MGLEDSSFNLRKRLLVTLLIPRITQWHDVRITGRPLPTFKRLPLDTDNIDGVHVYDVGKRSIVKRDDYM